MGSHLVIITRILIWLIAKLSPNVFNQIWFQLFVTSPITNSSPTFNVSSHVIWPFLDVRRLDGCVFTLTYLLKIRRELIVTHIVSTILDYHIMQYDTCSHDLGNFSNIPKQCWVANYSKTRLQYTESTLHVLSCWFLMIGKQHIFSSYRPGHCRDKCSPWLYIPSTR